MRLGLIRSHWIYRVLFQPETGPADCVNVRSDPEEQGAAVCISNLRTKLLLVQIWFLFLKWLIFPEIADNYYYYRLTLCINTPSVESLFPDFPDLSFLSLFPKLLQIAVSELFQFRGNRAN